MYARLDLTKGVMTGGWGRMFRADQEGRQAAQGPCEFASHALSPPPVCCSQTSAFVRVQVVVTSQPLCHELSGYMPYRQEFDVEYENEAEALISQLNFNDEDSPDDIGTRPAHSTPHAVRAHAVRLVVVGIPQS